MISYVKGPLVDIFEDTVIIEAGYIGLEIHVPLSVLDRLPGIGMETILYTYFQVREDGMCLYGFLNRQDLRMFKQLISVSGIGPKGALGVLSAMTPDDLRVAIISGDAKAISRAPGIGVKTAQRVIIELKDKIAVTGSAEEMNFGASVAIKEEALAALVMLGFVKAQANKVLDKIVAGGGVTSVEELIKQALKQL